ncbi:hypothetical protein GBAR_LOCUS394 [Geodia barretti]|uniref:Uncharacterized protein n=1 Tax=Geodia barretti TaxID=519541 RepID=A0AA35QSL1_GEOBA|nr:hypothetical protein GBAR_LOCUS394 [Geodia barretti]
MAKRHPRTSTPCPMGYLELSTILEHELNPGEQPTPENTMSPAALHQLEKRDTPETSCYGSCRHSLCPESPPVVVTLSLSLLQLSSLCPESPPVVVTLSLSLLQLSSLCPESPPVVVTLSLSLLQLSSLCP